MARLARGACPVHGVPPRAVGVDGTAAQLLRLRCPRLACGIEAVSDGMGEPARLAPEFQHLTGEANEPAGIPTVDTAEFEKAWRAAWAALRLTPERGALAGLLSGWSSAERRYHDLHHLRECLDLWRAWGGLCRNPGDVAIAIWYHDAVYEPRSVDNEERSAQWAACDLMAAGASGAVVDRVSELVLSTRMGSTLSTPDSRILSDIDLAILGSAPERYEQYARDIRSEFAWLSTERFRAERFRAGRSDVLRSFLARPRIYHCAPAASKLERRARDNIGLELRMLSAGNEPASVKD